MSGCQISVELFPVPGWRQIVRLPTAPPAGRPNPPYAYQGARAAQVGFLSNCHECSDSYLALGPALYGPSRRKGGANRDNPDKNSATFTGKYDIWLQLQHYF